MKQCTVCGIPKPLEAFTKDKQRKDGLYSQCKECKQNSGRKAYKGNPETFLQLQRKHNYGIAAEQYQALYEQQGGVCASCRHPEIRMYKGKVRNLAVEHCHTTGRVRGLLCHDCNTALGLLREDPERIKALLRYIHERAS